MEIFPVILIPDFAAGEAGFALACALVSRGFPAVAVCPPGDEASAGRAGAAGCAVAEAQGEQALRAGLAYCHENLPGLPGVVAVNAAEGYSAEDVLAIVKAMEAHPGTLIAASREANPSLGAMARLQRACARLAFAAVHGRQLRDPWANLRAIPAALVPAFLDLKGEGRRYEFAVVLNLQRKGVKAVSVPVGARYAFAEGSGPRERAGDILRILALPFKFISASLAATLCDYAVFFLLDGLILKGHWAISTTVSRSAGAIVGYFLNRSIVFKSKNDTWRKEAAAALKFAALAIANYGASMLIVYILHDLIGISEFLAKPMTDALLFVTSYTIQREIIFRNRNPVGK